MIWKFLQSIFGSLIASIQTKLDTWSGNKAIADDGTDIAKKKAEADVKLGELNDAGLLKTNIATGIQADKDAIVVADQKVADDTKKIEDDLAKPPTVLDHHVTGAELDDEFK